MALIVVFHNDNTGTPHTGHYNVTTLINEEVIWKGRIENFDRMMGWYGLIEALANHPSVAEPQTHIDLFKKTK